MRKDIDRVSRAIMDAVSGSQVKDKMVQFESRKAYLKALLNRTKEMPVAIHPSMGKLLPQAA